MIYDSNLEDLWGHCKKSNVIKHQCRFIHNNSKNIFGKQKMKSLEPIKTEKIDSKKTTYKMKFVISFKSSIVEFGPKD